MRAVILVGGLGTRLRPLTERTPKPMLPFFGRPLLAWILDPLLAAQAFESITVATGFASDAFSSWLDGLAPRVRQAVEPEPLGTAGGLAWALRADPPAPGSRLWVQNGDTLLWPSAAELLERHQAAGASITLGVMWHPEPQRFGRLEVDEAFRVRAFHEKDARHSGPGWINAGVYLLESEQWRLLEPVSSSLERDWFGRWLAAGVPLQACPLSGYFCDLGTPESYRQAHADVLNGRTPLSLGRGPGARALDTPGVNWSEPVWLDENVTLEPGCTLAGPLALGKGSHVAAGARVQDSVVGPQVLIAGGAVVERAVLGQGARVPAGGQVRERVLT